MYRISFQLLLWVNMYVNIRTIESNFHKGRAIAQAVSRRLPTAAARVQTRV
jgi:hypothetical protein